MLIQQLDERHRLHLHVDGDKWRGHFKCEFGLHCGDTAGPSGCTGPAVGRGGFGDVGNGDDLSAVIGWRYGDLHGHVEPEQSHLHGDLTGDVVPGDGLDQRRQLHLYLDRD